MTHDSEVEMVAKEITELICGSWTVTSLDEDDKKKMLDIARWHIREKEIAVLEARIKDREGILRTRHDILFDSVLNELQSRLSKLRKEKV